MIKTHGAPRAIASTLLMGVVCSSARAVGDFGAVGSVHVSYRDQIQDQVSATVGTLGFQRVFMAGLTGIAGGNLPAAVELQHNGHSRASHLRGSRAESLRHARNYGRRPRSGRKCGAVSGSTSKRRHASGFSGTRYRSAQRELGDPYQGSKARRRKSKGLTQAVADR